jgi:MFS transporter, putative metabolite:H+ symporter
MIEHLERQQGLTRNLRKLILAGGLGMTLEFLDYFLIGFILTFVARPWGLSAGMSSIILLSSGLGSIVGAAFFGSQADRVGRRRVFLTTISIFTLGMAALIVTPDSASFGWIYLTAFRFLIGVGAGGFYCVDLPLIQEFLPTSRRALVSGLVTCAVPLGFLLGSAFVAFLAPVIGWRGLMALCVVLSLGAVTVRRWVPESPYWLMRQGRLAEARASIAWALEVDAATIPITGSTTKVPPPRLRDLRRYPRSLTVGLLANLGMQTGYYGLTLWTPTLLVRAFDASPSTVALYMVLITFAALLGRITFSILAELVGRRVTGILCTWGAAAILVVTAMSAPVAASFFAPFMVILMLAFFFGEGGFATVGPYSSELWPTRLRATGMGAAYSFGSIGKIIGPAGLVLVFGSGTSGPAGASATQMQHAFLYFAFWYALACVAYLAFGVETKGRALHAVDDDDPPPIAVR